MPGGSADLLPSRFRRAPAFVMARSGALLSCLEDSKSENPAYLSHTCSWSEQCEALSECIHPTVSKHRSDPERYNLHSTGQVMCCGIACHRGNEVIACHRGNEVPGKTTLLTPVQHSVPQTVFSTTKY